MKTQCSDFFLRIEPEPPRVTHQMKRIGVRNGKPYTYEGARLKDARALLTGLLAEQRPDKPLDGAVLMETKWYFRGKECGYMTKRPDCDNLQKLLQDCMTACGFWRDDSQVMPFTQKFTVPEDGVHGIRITLSRLSLDD